MYMYTHTHTHTHIYIYIYVYIYIIYVCMYMSYTYIYIRVPKLSEEKFGVSLQKDFIFQFHIHSFASLASCFLVSYT